LNGRDAAAGDKSRATLGPARMGLTMSFCEHCQGQRFDRARILRLLRQVREDMRTARAGGKVDAALLNVLNSVRALDIPHLDQEEPEDEVVH
jgi:hypothetical protein